MRAPEPSTAGNPDQRHLAQGGDCGEREAVSEDEGAQCEDEGGQDDREPDQDHCVPCHLLHDQTQLGTYAGEAFTPVDPDDTPGDFLSRCEVGLS